MNTNNLIYVGLTILAGISVTIQGPINTHLGINLKSSEWATFLTFFLGTIAYGIYMLILRKPVPSLDLFINTPVWTYLGAITGALYVTLVILATPVLGVGATTILLLFAQITTAMIIDHYDLFNLGQRSFDMYKLLGIILVIIGVVLINKKS